MSQPGSRLPKRGIPVNLTGFSVLKSSIIFLQIQRLELQPRDSFFGGKKKNDWAIKACFLKFLLFCSMVWFEINWDERNVSNLKRAGFPTFSKWNVSICLLETNFSLPISFQGSLSQPCFLHLSNKNSSFFPTLVCSH